MAREALPSQRRRAAVARGARRGRGGDASAPARDERRGNGGGPDPSALGAALVRGAREFATRARTLSAVAAAAAATRARAAGGDGDGEVAAAAAEDKAGGRGRGGGDRGGARGRGREDERATIVRCDARELDARLTPLFSHLLPGGAKRRRDDPAPGCDVHASGGEEGSTEERRALADEDDEGGGWCDAVCTSPPYPGVYAAATTHSARPTVARSCDEAILF